MALTLKELDRRVTALELAQSARSENAVARLEQKVDAFPRVVAEMIAESEDRLRGAISTSVDAAEDRLREAISTSVHASEQRMREETERILTVVNAAEQRTAGLINDSEQRILVALDRLKNP